MFDPNATAQVLIQQGVPPQKASAKSKTIAQGIAFLVIGLFLMLVSAVMVFVPMILLREMPGVAFLIFAGLFGGAGVVLVFAGGHVMSGEALDAAAQTGGVIAKSVAKAVHLIRGGK